MTMRLILALLCLAWLPTSLRAAPAASAENAPQGVDKVKSWFKNWKDGLTRSAVHGYRQNRRAVAVAAVRGEKQRLDNPDTPYLKGSVGSKEAEASRRQAAELSAAVDLILNGDVAGGSKKLDEFEQKNPGSPFLKDVTEARQMLKSAETPAKTEDKPEAKTKGT